MASGAGEHFLRQLSSSNGLQTPQEGYSSGGGAGGGRRRGSSRRWSKKRAGRGGYVQGGAEAAGRKRVMVVVDDSSGAKHAMMWALTHVANRGDFLTLLHVLPPHCGGGDDDMAPSLANSLGTLCKACRPEVEIEALVIQGPKLATVLSQVKKLEASVLVLSQTKPSTSSGDHIYSWRGAWVYAHHGIYVGDDMVIHFNRGRDQEVGTGTVIDRLLASSLPARSSRPCLVCRSSSNHGGVPAAAATDTNGGVTSSCLSCFLAGGALYRFEYGVSPALFFAKVRKGTCTVVASDPDEVVVRRAYYFWINGFGTYNLLKNNCENFAMYCKTGSVRPSGQALSGFAATAATAIVCVLLI